jgi:DNA-binding transcriptional LysR family regulator
VPNASRTDLADLKVFMAIMHRGSFRRAAVELGLSASALSHTMRKLETRLGVRLLNRTARAVVATPAGTRLAERLRVGFAAIDEALGELETQRQFPIGLLRINAPQDATRLLIVPVLASFVDDFSHIELDLTVEDRIIDIIGEGFDAGIRFGERVPRDMISVPLTGPLRWVVVGSPSFLGRNGRPAAPEDLMRMPCIRARIGDGSILSWELGDGAAMVTLDVRGPVCVNDPNAIIEAARRGVGLAYCLEPRVRDEVDRGDLEIVLPEWASEGPPLCMYYPSRRQPPPGLRQLIDAIRTSNGLTPLGTGRLARIGRE